MFKIIVICLVYFAYTIGLSKFVTYAIENNMKLENYVFNLISIVLGPGCGLIYNKLIVPYSIASVLILSFLILFFLKSNKIYLFIAIALWLSSGFLFQAILNSV
jgi:hypothetical protein